MLMSNEFVKAEDKYRRELLRDHYQSEYEGRVGKFVAVMVAGALLLAACGDSNDTNPGASERTDTEVTSEQGVYRPRSLDADTVRGGGSGGLGSREADGSGIGLVEFIEEQRRDNEVVCALEPVPISDKFRALSALRAQSVYSWSGQLGSIRPPRE